MVMEIERKSGVKNIVYRGIIFNLIFIYFFDLIIVGFVLMYLKYFFWSFFVLLMLLFVVGM